MYTPPDKTSLTSLNGGFALHPPALMLPKTVDFQPIVVLGNPDTTDFEPVVVTSENIDYSLQPCSVSAENTFSLKPLLELVDKSTVTLGLEDIHGAGASWTNLGKSSSAGNYYWFPGLLKDTLNTNVANHRMATLSVNFLYNGTWDKPINSYWTLFYPYVSGTPTAAELAGSEFEMFTGADNKRFYFRVRLPSAGKADDNGKYPAATPVNQGRIISCPVASSISWNTLYTNGLVYGTGAEGWYKFFYQGRVIYLPIITHSQLLNATISAGALPPVHSLLQGNTIAGYFGTTTIAELSIRYTVPSGAIYPDSGPGPKTPQTLKLNISGNCPAFTGSLITLVASDLQSPDASLPKPSAFKDTVLTVRDALPAINDALGPVYYDRINLATLFNFVPTVAKRNTKAVFTGYPGTGVQGNVIKLTPAIAALTSGPTSVTLNPKESALLVYDQVNRDNPDLVGVGALRSPIFWRCGVPMLFYSNGHR
ncbi:hypothetical protein SPFM12_00141 [Salmonella phage SPFM12]|nr:hypothetical protein SPFM12_00141 [Salmonella phage SPFM12]